ncbi:hypothetical protein ABU162_25620 [Paenibacillus thiaminolyticus]|uniref:hypothetical protein n=1 Tax=Paenibacillus thiaminolyticus TaxID=49283 RepID=UPI0035A721AC
MTTIGTEIPVERSSRSTSWLWPRWAASITEAASFRSPSMADSSLSDCRDRCFDVDAEATNLSGFTAG